MSSKFGESRFFLSRKIEWTQNDGFQKLTIDILCAQSPKALGGVIYLFESFVN